MPNTPIGFPYAAYRMPPTGLSVTNSPVGCFSASPLASLRQLKVGVSMQGSA